MVKKLSPIIDLVVSDINSGIIHFFRYDPNKWEDVEDFINHHSANFENTDELIWITAPTADIKIHF